MKRRGEKVLRPLHPNAGIGVEYRRRLDDLIAAMQVSYERAVLRSYRANIAADRTEPPRVTAVQLPTNHPGERWSVYVDGKVLRGKGGAIRTWKSQDAAEVAGLKNAGVFATLTVPVGINDRFSTDILARLPLQPTPADNLSDVLGGLGTEWERRFAETGPKLAEWFTRSAANQSTLGLKRILREGGVSVQFELTPEIRNIVQATMAENVGLIRSIASQYHTEIEGMVMRSVASGRNVGMLTRELEQRFGVTRRRAAFIALDQNNKATAVIVAARQAEAGIDEAIWLHSHGGKVPRRTHLANDGKRYKIAEGWFDPDPKVRRYIKPGELIRCRCVSRSIVKGFE